MSTRAAILFLLAIAFATPSATAGELPAPSDAATAAVLIRRVPALYPAKAVDRQQEGWVDVRFSITPEGTTSAVRILGEFPRHVFSRSAINAIAKWTYRPRLEGGVAVPQGNNRVVLSFALSESTAIRENHMAQFTAAHEALTARDWAKATKAVNEIAAAEPLNLFELASLEEIKGRIAFGQQRFAEAADCLARALEITGHFSPDTRDGISALLVRSKQSSGDDAAATPQQRWQPLTDHDRR